MIRPAELYERLGFPIKRRGCDPIAIAHRGASAYALENTEAAFRKAAALGADMWEIDVQLSADGVPVISHDDDLGAMAGKAVKISKTAWNDLQAITLGNGERLLSLDHAIDLALELDAGLYVEIKADGAGAKTWKQLEARRFERAVIGSFQHHAIEELRKAGCSYPLSILVPVGTDPILAAERTGADVIHPCWLDARADPQMLLTEALLQEAESRGLSIVTWHEERRSVLDVLERLPIFGICSNRPETIKPYRRDSAHPIRLVCHRGANHVAPENTEAAARICFDQRFDFVEVDVRTSSDGALVVIHDDTVDRTTSGTGYVADMNLSKMRALDAGSWFEPHFSTETIPTLGEMLTLARAYGRGLYIEPKAADPAAVLHEVRAQQMLKRCFFGSVMPDIMREFRRLAPDAILMARRCDFTSLEETITDTNAQIIEFDVTSDDLGEVTRCRDLGVASMIFSTTTDRSELKRLHDLKPDYLNLDRPDLAKRCLPSRMGRVR
ncbi:MAG: glycerophosphodiester phosphodiesterase family protein [Geminicoccales bacterium]